MSRVDLPDGGWVELADPATVPERKRRPVKRALAASRAHMMSQEATHAWATGEVEITDATYDACILALVTHWSYGDEVTGEALQDLPGVAYDALRAACFELLPKLMPRFDPDPDPKEPPSTTNSSE